MKAFKKAIALALAFCMLVQPLPASAAETGTKPANGTTTNEPFPKGTAGSNSFRIPSLVTLSDGTLVAAADARWNTTFDGGGLDTIVSRSENNGANWSYSFANYLGDNGNEYNGSSSTCFIDPAMAVTSDDTIYMLVDLYPYGIALNGSGNTAPSTATGFDSQGRLLLYKDNSTYTYYLSGNTIYSEYGYPVRDYSVDEHFNITGTDGTDTNIFFSDSPFKVARTGFLYLTKSTDKGKTWSAPTLLNLKTTSEQVCLVGPGRGLVTKNGMIVFPCYSYKGDQNTQQTSFIYSTDNGSTWKRSSSYTGASWSSESAVVELSDGTLRFFYRNDTSNLCYVDYNVTSNRWGSGVNTGLDTNSNCQISAITYSKTVDGKQVILVSCPTGPNGAGSNDSSASARQNGKIFVGLVNTDKTISWQTEKAISVKSKNSSNSFMYSCLTELKDGKIALLYEDHQNAWGTGSNCYYQMSYATYDFPMTADAGGTGDSGDSSDEMKTKNIELYVGESKSVTDNTGNYEPTYTGEGLDSNIATVEVEGNVGVADTTVSTSKTTVLEDGATYIIRVYETSYALSSNSGRRDWNTETRAFEQNDLVVNSKHFWKLEASGSGYKLKNEAGYLALGNINNAATLNSVGEVFDIKYTSTGWTIGNEYGRYINALGGLTSYYSAGGWTGDGTRFDLYKVTESTESSTDITFTGVAPGTTAVVVGNTTYNITVNKKADFASIAIGSTATFNGAGTKIERNTNSSVASATVSNGVLTVKGVAAGTTTITTDYGVYTITVSDGTPITIKEKETMELSVDLNDGQYVEWSTADSSYVGVAGKYDASAKKYTDTSVIIGHNVTDTPVVVTGTIYNADGTKAGTQKWLVTVIEGDADTNTSQKHIYVNVTAIENCTVYYAVNGGELVKINGTGILVDEDIKGHYNIMFFADPDEGYALTYMSVSGSAQQYYTLSDGNPDGTGSGAWPFDSATQSTIPTTSGDSAWVDGHGFRWSLLEGNMTIEQMKLMFSTAIALGCDGATNFTKNANESFYTEVQFAAQKLPTVEKEIVSITRENDVTETYTEGMKVVIGDTINYKIHIQEYAETTGPIYNHNAGYTVTNSITSTNKPTYYNGSYGIIEYSKEQLNDPLTGDNWEPDLVTSSTTESVHTFDTKIKLTKDNFNTVVKNGKITNTADFTYHYKSNYSTGTLKASASAVAEITVDIPSYVVDFGLPVTFNLSELAFVYGNIEKASATYGDVAVSGNNVTYTPTTTLKDVDYIELDLEKGHYAIAIYPATTVYYEEGFAEGSTGDWKSFSKTTDLKQTAEEVGTKANVYGFDGAYNSVGASNGTTSTSDEASIGTFTFTGTGVDIYTNNTESSGVLMAWVKNSAGNTVKAIQVDTHMANGSDSYTEGQNVNAYNVPVVSLTGLERDTYTVELRHIGQSMKTENADGTTTSSVVYKPVSLDGYRVHGTLDPATMAYQMDNEAGPVFFELRNSVLAGLNVNAANSEYAEDIAEDTLAQVYARAEGTAGAVVLSNGENNTYADNAKVQDLIDNGPKNELYLRAGEAVVFKVPLGYQIQAGMKALNAEVSYSLNGSDTSVKLNTSTDMFYIVNGITNEDDATQTITIKNNGGGILSITEIKMVAQAAGAAVEPAFMSLEEEDLVPVLMTYGYRSENAEPEVTYADASLNIVLNDALGNVLTSTTLTANGVVGEANTFSAATIKEAVTALVPEGYELKDAVYTDVEVTYGEEAAVTFTAEDNQPKYADATLTVKLTDKKGNVIAEKALTANGLIGETHTFKSNDIKKAATSILPNGYKLRNVRYSNQKVVYGEEATVTFTAEGNKQEYADATLTVKLTDRRGNVIAEKALTANGVVGKTHTFNSNDIKKIATYILPSGYKLKNARYSNQKVAYGKSATVSFTVESSKNNNRR